MARIIEITREDYQIKSFIFQQVFIMDLFRATYTDIHRPLQIILQLLTPIKLILEIINLI